MGLIRRLTAQIPGELLAAQIATTSRPGPTAADPESVEYATPDANHRDVFAVLGFLDDNPGVIDHTTPGLPVPARTEGDPQ